ncbi:MAG: glycosyltransferase [Desulfobacterales bacterium]
MKKRPDSAIKTIDRRFPVPGQMSARILFLFLWAADAVWSWFARQKPRHTVPCETLSIVIPTRNEEAFIKRCIQAVVGNPCVCEAIVVDAASHDRTQSLAQQAGAWYWSMTGPLKMAAAGAARLKRASTLPWGTWWRWFMQTPFCRELKLTV